MRSLSPLVLAVVVWAAGCAADRASSGSPIANAVPEGAGSGEPAFVLGPMVGHTTDRSTRLWARVDRRGVLGAVLTGENGDVEEARATTDAEGYGIVEVDELDPGIRYAARFELDGRPIVSDPPVLLRTFPREGDPSPIRIALVSCSRVAWDSVQTIWAHVAADRPDVVLWLGDNNYFEEYEDRPPDWSDPDRMAFKYAELRALETLQPLLRSAIHYAMWDDHDYADDSPDRTFELREEVSRIFELFWANPSYGSTEAIDGTYSSFRAGDVEVFLTDDRFYRDPEGMPDGPGKSMLGEAQLEWLTRALEASDATLKIVAVGVQVLADYHQYDGYHHYAHERDRLLRFIVERGIPGVVFVSGDRHLSELMRWTPEGGYPLYELTASPIANRFFPAGLDQPNPIRIGGWSDSPNYGLLDVDPAAGRLVFRLKDENGREVLTHEVPLSDLRPPPRPGAGAGERR